MIDQRERELLRHMLAAIAYRTQKAVRGAPDRYSDFDLGHQARTPRQLIEHMTHLMGFSCTQFDGESFSFELEPLENFDAEVARFHAQVERLGECFTSGVATGIATEQFIQGPLSDALTHVGQLAYLRRLAGSAVQPEKFIDAEVRSDRLGVAQADPKAPK